MYSSAILNVANRRLSDKTLLKEEIYEGFSVITLPERKRALRKLLRASDKNYIVKNGDSDKGIFQGRIKPFTDISPETVISVIDKICREAAKKYLQKLPFEEIKVISSGNMGLRIVEKLKNEAKLFTVIAESEDRLLADELYFKYGVIIRYKNSPDIRKGMDNLIISAEESVTEKITVTPVINLSKRNFSRENVINIGEIVITDKNTSVFSEYWNGCPGPEIYSLLNISPQECSEVDINKKTDRIFLLDTDAF